MTEDRLSHVDDAGKLRMVDVSAKGSTLRVARSRCLVVTSCELSELAPISGGLDAVQAARLAGIQAAKLTANLVPLCHPLGVDDIQVDVTPHPRGAEVRASVRALGRTGVEMEALTASLFCATSLVVFLASEDPAACVDELVILSKSGGKSDWGTESAVHDQMT